jgi:hypothetical protein
MLTGMIGASAFGVAWALGGVVTASVCGLVTLRRVQTGTARAKGNE